MSAEVSEVDRLMYDCGLEVLHPGGLAISEEMARACLPAATLAAQAGGAGEGSRVLDVGVGKGATARLVAERLGCSVVGVDASEEMIESARERARGSEARGRIEFRVADACELPFAEGVFDAVVVECVSTMLDRERAFPELVRALRPGGRLGDLEMTFLREPGAAFRRRLERAWGGFTSMTIDGWRALFERHGLSVVACRDFSDLLPELARELASGLGLRGGVRLLARLARSRELSRAMVESARVFREGKDVFGYAYLVGEKPAA
jgi:SAM-dependent methyltransferase